MTCFLRRALAALHSKDFTSKDFRTGAYTRPFAAPKPIFPPLCSYDPKIPETSRLLVMAKKGQGRVIMRRNTQNSICQFSAIPASSQTARTSARSLSFLGCMIIATFVVMLAPRAWSQPDTVLHNFAPAPDSDNSTSTLVADQFGNLYGTASEGGANQLGTVFVLCAPGAVAPPPCAAGIPPWTEFILYSFKGPGVGDGANPYSTLIFGGNYAGRALTLYGTTYNGGNPNTCQGQGCGTVFELCAPAVVGGCGGAAWTENVLWRFAGNKDGSHPFAGVIADKANFLYGTTVYGGAKGVCKVGGVNVFCGTVFKMKHNAAWVFTEAPIHRFKGAPVDGANPYAAPCCNSNFAIPTLYGTTLNGGAKNEGSVFQVANAPGFAEALLYNFCSVAGCTDGANPYASVTFDANANMYGTTYHGGTLGGCGGPGCGTIFKLSALPIPLYNFVGAPDGANPTAGLTFNAGILYGTTYDGGIPGGCGGAGCGTVYKFTLPGGPEVVRWRFNGGPFDGANPWGGVIFDPLVPGGFLYGTTLDAGQFGFGIAYSE
jgi:uncharacterized repeat protein (TIGR03803 family)